MTPLDARGRRLAGPWRVDTVGGKVTRPAWRTKLSWYLVATDDRMIPPSAQRALAHRAGSTVSEVAASHSIYVSQPRAKTPYPFHQVEGRGPLPSGSGGMPSGEALQRLSVL